MRWPLRYQMLLPMIVVLLLTVAVLSWVSAWLAARNKQREIAGRIQAVAQTIARANFPLTPQILVQIKDLINAELLLQRADGSIVSSTTTGLPTDRPTPEQSSRLKDGASVQMPLDRYVRATIVVRSQRGEPEFLHIYYPQADYVRQRREAILPAIIIGGMAMLVVASFALWFSARLSKPISLLREKTEQIALGDFQPIEVSNRDDELRDLEISVNHMADQLAQFERDTRQIERIRTLGLLGSGLAHQLRNSATGAKLAIDLHREHCPLVQESEGLDVAQRQLVLMEKYLKKFLSLSADESLEFSQVDVRYLIESLMPLVVPTASHVGVVVSADLGDDDVVIDGNIDGIEQLVLNLVWNAIDAAASSASVPNGGANRLGKVRLTLRRLGSDRLRLAVTDSGAGPSSEIALRMFEPFITEKPGGVGLGLSMVNRVVQQHGGTVDWYRHDNQTEFVVELPMTPDHTQHDRRIDVKSVDRG